MGFFEDYFKAYPPSYDILLCNFHPWIPVAPMGIVIDKIHTITNLYWAIMHPLRVEYRVLNMQQFVIEENT